MATLLVTRARNSLSECGLRARVAEREREGSTKLFGIGLQFIFARFVKSAEIVLCLSVWHKIEKLLCVSVPKNKKKKERKKKQESEIVATYESVTRNATLS